MILTDNRRSIITASGNFAVGDRIIAIDSDYAGLKGIITEIRTGNDKDTENETDDIYCSFDIPEDEEDLKNLEAHFSDLYGEKKTADDLCLDLVIMAPEEIKAVSENE